MKNIENLKGAKTMRLARVYDVFLASVNELFTCMVYSR